MLKYEWQINSPGVLRTFIAEVLARYFMQVKYSPKQAVLEINKIANLIWNKLN